MARDGIDLVVVGPSSNLRYLLGYQATAFERLTALLVSRESAVMILPAFDAEEFVAITEFEAVAAWTDRKGPATALSDAFGHLGVLPPQPRALVDDELPFQFFASLRSRLGREPRLASELLGGLRLIKSDDEQATIARAGALVSEGIDVAQAAALPEITELQLKRTISDAMWDQGAESVDCVLVQAGPNSAVVHHAASDTKLREGEPVLIDIAVRLDGYFADITQQVFLGEPPDEYREVYEIVALAQEAGVSATRPGTAAGEVAATASAVIVEAGYGEWIQGRTGHGLGLDVHEPPSVVEGADTELRPGAVITIEPGIYIPGKYGVRIEDTVLVTDGEAKRLTRGARPLFAK
jgi:Xaa-Pro dipeptidase